MINSMNDIIYKKVINWYNIVGCVNEEFMEMCFKGYQEDII